MDSLYLLSFHFTEIIPILSWIKFFSPMKHCPGLKRDRLIDEMELFSYLSASVACGVLAFQHLLDIIMELFLVTLLCFFKTLLWIFSHFCAISIIIFFFQNIWNKRFQEINILTGLTLMIFFPGRTTHRSKNSAWNYQWQISRETLSKEIEVIFHSSWCGGQTLSLL